jgi:LPXTG-motif cell wall-anchored protein
METREIKTRYKMFKAGKLWLVMGASVAVFMTGAASASADTATATTDITSSTDSASGHEDDSQQLNLSAAQPQQDETSPVVSQTDTVTAGKSDIADNSSDLAPTESTAKADETVSQQPAAQPTVAKTSEDIVSNLPKGATVVKNTTNEVAAVLDTTPAKTLTASQVQVVNETMTLSDTSKTPAKYSLSSSGNTAITIDSPEFQPLNTTFTFQVDNSKGDINAGDTYVIPFSITNVSGSSNATWGSVPVDVLDGDGQTIGTIVAQGVNGGYDRDKMTYTGQYIFTAKDIPVGVSAVQTSLGNGLSIGAYDSSAPIQISLGDSSFTVTPKRRLLVTDDQNFFSAIFATGVAPDQINAGSGTWDPNYYNSVLSGNTKIGDTGIPTGDVVIVQHINVTADPDFSNEIGRIAAVTASDQYTTSLNIGNSKTPYGGTGAGSAGNPYEVLQPKKADVLVKYSADANMEDLPTKIIHSNIPAELAAGIPSNATDAQIATALQQAGVNTYYIAVSADGLSAVVAYNYGTMLDADQRANYTADQYYPDGTASFVSGNVAELGGDNVKTDDVLLSAAAVLRNQQDFEIKFTDSLIHNHIDSTGTAYSVAKDGTATVLDATLGGAATTNNATMAAGQTAIKVLYINNVTGEVMGQITNQGFPTDIGDLISDIAASDPAVVFDGKGDSTGDKTVLQKIPGVANQLITTPSAASQATLTSYGVTTDHILSDDETLAYPTEALAKATGSKTVIYAYLYTPNVEEASDDVTKVVHYQTADGTSLAPDYSSSVNFKETRSTDAVSGAVTVSDSPESGVLGHQANPEIKGYHVISNPATAESDQTVKFGDADIDVTVVYEKDAPEPVTPVITPDTPVEPDVPATPVPPVPTEAIPNVPEAPQPEPKAPETPALPGVPVPTAHITNNATVPLAAVKTRTQLPHTNATENHSGVLVGAAVLATSLIFGLGYKKRH